jgi:hypothetical protein
MRRMAQASISPARPPQRADVNITGIPLYSYLHPHFVMMESLRFTEKETALAIERRLKFQGTAKVDLDQMHFDAEFTRPIDQRVVDRLCNLFRKDECHNLALENRVPATVSRHHLSAALQTTKVNAHTLLTSPPSQIPRLHFLPGQVVGLHGQHRIRAGSNVLSPAQRCWAIDLYLDGEISR